MWYHLPCTSLTRYVPSMLWVVCLFTVITIYTSCIGTARRLRCICHSYHTINNILNILRMLNPTTHKLPTHTWHGSLFLLFLQLAIQKIFIFVFTLYIDFNGANSDANDAMIFWALSHDPGRAPGLWFNLLGECKKLNTLQTLDFLSHLYTTRPSWSILLPPSLMDLGWRH